MDRLTERRVFALVFGLMLLWGGLAPASATDAQTLLGDRVDRLMSERNLTTAEAMAIVAVEAIDAGSDAGAVEQLVYSLVKIANQRGEGGDDLLATVAGAVTAAVVGSQGPLGATVPSDIGGRLQAVVTAVTRAALLAAVEASPAGGADQATEQVARSVSRGTIEAAAAAGQPIDEVLKLAAGAVAKGTSPAWQLDSTTGVQASAAALEAAAKGIAAGAMQAEVEAQSVALKKAAGYLAQEVVAVAMAGGLEAQEAVRATAAGMAAASLEVGQAQQPEADRARVVVLPATLDENLADVSQGAAEGAFLVVASRDGASVESAAELVVGAVAEASADTAEAHGVESAGIDIQSVVTEAAAEASTEVKEPPTTETEPATTGAPATTTIVPDTTTIAPATTTLTTTTTTTTTTTSTTTVYGQ